jgi:hypothetical protein
VNLPFMVGSAEIGTKVLNDPGLRARYLDGEHKGVKVLILFTHQPGGPHTTKKAIRTLDDFKGLRLRFASPTVRDLVAALGATPVGVPPTEIAEQLQKGTIDGAFIDYGGAGIAFKLGGTVKYSTELYLYVTSFGLALNEEFWGKLPPDLKKLVLDTTTGKEKEIGEAWDGLDVPGKKALMDGGAEAIRFSAAENAKVRKIGAEVSEEREVSGKALEATIKPSLDSDLPQGVNEDRVHSQHDERECPLLKPFHFDEPVEDHQHEDHPACAEERERGRPKTLDHRNEGFERQAQGEAGDGSGRHRLQFLVFLRRHVNGNTVHETFSKLLITHQTNKSTFVE